MIGIALCLWRACPYEANGDKLIKVEIVIFRTCGIGMEEKVYKMNDSNIKILLSVSIEQTGFVLSGKTKHGIVSSR